MNVAIACERFDAHGGGLERWTSQLVERLERRGHFVNVVCFRVGRRLEGAPTRLHVLPWSSSRLRRSDAATGALLDLGADVTHDLGIAGHADVIHPQAGSGRANRQRDLMSRDLGDRWRRRLRPSYWTWLREISELERRQYRHSAGLVIAVSRTVAADLQHFHGVASERIRVIPNGIDSEWFTPDLRQALRGGLRNALGVTPETTVFLFAARNLRLKGFRPLLHALSRIRARHSRVALVVIGGSPGPDEQQLVTRLGLDECVRFGGLIADPRAHYAAADVFVLPTYHDACSLTVLEASACGLPSITTARNGASELMTHGRDGFVISEADAITELARAMDACLDPALRRRMAPASRALGVCCSIDRNVDAIEALYLEQART